MSKKKILIVEDERIIAEDLNRTLTRLGYEVTGIASSSQKALEMAEADIPDLAVMDIILQGKRDGITVANRLRDRFDIPAIYLTAYADKEILRRAKISSPYGYILKPFDERELHINVEIALERSSAKRLLRRTNAVLKTVRNINQLIVREEEAGTLIKSACQILTEEGTYPRSWIVLLDKEGQMTTNAQSGWGKKFELLKKMLKEDKIPDCGGKALHSKKVIISSGSSQCHNCPFHKYYPEYDNLTIALRSHGEIYGLMSVALTGKNHVSKEEADLFRELAGDVAFALHEIELEEKSAQNEIQLHKTMKQLLESENRLKAIIDTEPECVKLLDAKGNLVDMNKAGLKMIEADTLEQVKGHKILSLVAPEYRKAFGNMIKKVVSGGSEILEFRIIGLKGSNRWLETHSVPHYDANNNIIGLLGVTRDVTDKKKMVEALEESELKYRKLVENSRLGMALYLKNGKYLFGNLRFSEITGYSEQEIQSPDFDFADLFSEKDAEIIRMNSKKRFVGDKIPPYALPIRTKDNKEKFIEINNTLMEYNEEPAVQIQIMDVTARIQAEREFKAVFSSNPLPVIILNQNRTVLQVNSEAEKYCERTSEKLVGMRQGDILLCIHRLDDPKGCGFGPDCNSCTTRNTILDTFQDKQIRNGIISTMNLLIDGAAHERIISLNTSSFDTADGPRVMVIFEDITEKHETQNEISRLKNFSERILMEMAEGIVILDDEGIMTYVNPATKNLLGFEKEELLGKRWSHIITKDQHPIVQMADKERLEGKRSTYELVLVDKKGRRINVLVNGSPRFQDGKFSGTMAVFTDISEQKNAENELKKKMHELDRTNKLMVGRELKMIELKREVNKLLEKSGQSKKYSSPDEMD